MDLRLLNNPRTETAELSQYAAPYSYEPAGRRFTVAGRELLFSERPHKTVRHDGNAYPAYAARVTDSLIFSFFIGGALLFDAETGAYKLFEKNGSIFDGGLQTALAGDLGGNVAEWRLGGRENASLRLEYVSDGARLEIAAISKRSLSVGGFVCHSVAEGVFFQLGRFESESGPGMFSLVTDYAKLLCFGALLLCGEPIPLGGYGKLL